MLKIELSLPKLLFGNNFEELTQKQFPELVEKLCSILQTMGIVTNAETLASASISGIYNPMLILAHGDPIKNP